MGKKKLSKKPSYIDNICVVLVSQYKRRKFLPLLFECISNQTYPKELFVEFVIVDGSKDEKEQPLYKEYINDINLLFNFPIKYISTIGEQNKNIGRLRNISLASVSEDKNIKYIICLDDDDYQFKTRFEESVKLFKKSKKELMGTNCQYLYDFNTDTTLRFIQGVWGLNHSVASCFAMTYNYAKTHFYDETKSFAEEASFTNEYNYPMAQLPTNDAIIGFAYGDGNTFNKIDIITGNIINREEKGRTADTYIQDGLIERLIGKTTFKKWINVIKEVSNFQEKSDFDITYFTTNGQAIPWSPYEKSLGGSEHHIEEITKAWVKKGYKVEVYCRLPNDESELTYEGVVYKDYKRFDYRKQYNILVLWRLFGMNIWKHLKIKAKQVYCDLHDTNDEQVRIAYQKQNEITGVMMKHNFHNEVHKYVCKEWKYFPENKVYFIPNGIRKKVFETNFNKVEKSRYKCVFASSYVRGLMPFLEIAYPIIKKAIPEFEIHICYGMKIEPDDFKNKINELFKQEGVFEYGKLDKEEVSKLKWSCGFHLYPLLDPFPEIFCISLHESYLTRTIPITFGINIFKDLPAINVGIDDITGDDRFVKAYVRYAESVIAVLKNTSDEELEKIRDALISYEGIKNWEQVGDLWIETFKQNEKNEDDYLLV